MEASATAAVDITHPVKCVLIDWIRLSDHVVCVYIKMGMRALSTYTFRLKLHRCGIYALRSR